MKKAILSLAVTAASIFAVNTTVLAQPEVNATSKAVITIDKEVHDYGTIEQGANGECVFTVTNTGTEPLIISLCKGSCGCTVPVCPQEPIAPGASAKITVKYNTANPGPINKSVTITSNASNEPSKTVRISGNVTAKPAGGAPVNTGGPTNQ
ncbi:MAG: DUF1573 domain-containing protein [Bacteroidetes bacterium]|nr:DUF1573 domain-containing protein [Bacteroidota bacterium]